MHAIPAASTLDEAPALSNGRRLAEVLLILLTFVVVAGDPAPAVNEAHYLSRMKHAWSPGWAAGDLFLESPDAHLTVVWAFGWLTRWLSLGATAWVGRLVVWTALAWAWQRLSWRLIPLPYASVLTAALWVTLMRIGHMAGEWVVGGFEAKGLAYALVLLALGQLIDRHWNRVWMLLGAASAFHVLVGGWSVVLVAAIWLHDQQAGQANGRHWLISLRSMLPGLIGGGLLATLGVVPALSLTLHTTPELVAEANQIYVFERLPHHLSLLTLPHGQIVDRLSRHALLLAGLVGLLVVRRRRGESSGPPQEVRSAVSDNGLTTIAWFACGAALLAAIGFLLELALWNRPAWAAALLKFYWFRMTDFAVPLAVALLWVALAVERWRLRRGWAMFLLIAALALPTWHLARTVARRVVNPTPPADAHMHDPTAWAGVCEWISANTPHDAMFLTPKWSTSFVWRTGRPQVVTWKDVPQDAVSMVAWFDRIRTFWFQQVDGNLWPIHSLAQLPPKQLATALAEHQVDYVVTRRSRPLELPIVYWNRGYAVYTVDR